jgi:uncharacterized OsmC-like protein
MEDAHIVVTSSDRLQQIIEAGKHHFIADEPLADGGDDAGPTPYDLLLSALGT